MRKSKNLNIFRFIGLIILSIFLFGIANAVETNANTLPENEVKVDVGTGATLNVRTQPSMSGSVIGRLADKEVARYSPSGVKGWAKVTTSKVTGYSSTGYLNFTTDDAVVNVGAGNNLNVRTLPSISGKVVGMLSDKQAIKYAPSGVDGWVKVNAGKLVGYSSTKYLELPAGKTTVTPTTPTETAKVTVGTGRELNVRSAPSISGTVKGTLKDQEVVTIQSSGVSGWAKVTTSKLTGYSSTKYLTVVKQEAPAPTPTAPTTKETAKVTVGNGGYLNVRSTPSISGSVKGMLKDQQVVTIQSSGVSGWAKVTTDTLTGYSSTKYLTVVKESTPTPVAPVVVKETAKVTVGAGRNLNVRATPSISGTVKGMLHDQQIVTIQSSGVSGWAKVTTDNLTGYSSTKYLTVVKESAPAPTTPKNIATVNVNANDTLNVRTLPSMTGKVIGTLSNGQQVEYEDSGVYGWTKVKSGNFTGYAATSYLVLSGEATSQSLKGKVIVLDPGHGGYESGAVFGGLVEKTLNLNISLKTKRYLESKGATVYMTRTTDTRLSLDARSRVASQKDADIFVSIHNNASGNHTLYGTETFYNTHYFNGYVNPYPAQSKSLATKIQNRLGSLPTRNIGAKDMAFYVLRMNSVPSALVEVAFLDHTGDSALLKRESFLDDSAELIAAGIEDYFKY